MLGFLADQVNPSYLFGPCLKLMSILKFILDPIQRNPVLVLRRLYLFSLNLWFFFVVA